jgi:hypothetical protein
MCATPKKSGAINDTLNAIDDVDDDDADDSATTSGGIIQPRNTISSVNGANTKLRILIHNSASDSGVMNDCIVGLNKM